MQVTADNQTHAGSVQPVEQSLASRWHHACGSDVIVGRILQEEGLVQEQGDGPLSGGAQLLVEPLVLCLLPRQARAKELSVYTDQAPVSSINRPAIAAKKPVP